MRAALQRSAHTSTPSTPISVKSHGGCRADPLQRGADGPGRGEGRSRSKGGVSEEGPEPHKRRRLRRAREAVIPSRGVHGRPQPVTRARKRARVRGAVIVSPHNVRTKIVRTTPRSANGSIVSSRRIGGAHARVVSLIDRASDTFLRGARALLTAALGDGVTVEVLDRRRPPCERNRDADLGWLRPHQRAAIERTYTRERGIWCLPTGAGKGSSALRSR